MNKTKIFKILAFIVFILLIIFITIKVFPIFKNIFTLEGRIEFQNEIQNLGIKGVFVILALIFIQIFLLFLPIEPVELLAGMCYGTWGGLAVIYLGAIIATTISLSSRNDEINLIELLSKTKYGKDGMGGLKSKGMMYIGYPR